MQTPIIGLIAASYFIDPLLQEWLAVLPKTPELNAQLAYMTLIAGGTCMVTTYRSEIVTAIYNSELRPGSTHPSRKYLPLALLLLGAAIDMISRLHHNNTLIIAALSLLIVTAVGKYMTTERSQGPINTEVIRSKDDVISALYLLGLLSARALTIGYFAAATGRTLDYICWLGISIALFLSQSSRP